MKGRFPFSRLNLRDAGITSERQPFGMFKFHVPGLKSRSSSAVMYKEHIDVIFKIKIDVTA